MERRKHRRFDVSEVNDIRLRTDQDLTGIHLQSLGFGGCGFICSGDDFELKLGDRVKCSFEVLDTQYEKEPIQIEGHILYMRPHPMNLEVGRYVGIAFMANDIEKIDELLAFVEEMDVPSSINFSKAKS